MRDLPRITIQFHPDWPHGSDMVIESMAKDGVYWSQFVTGTSNGGLTAHPGGDRWRWESRLFSGRYDDSHPSTRPIYGALDRRNDPYGAAFRFGSAHLRLRPETTARGTFCFPDSTHDPVDFGGPETIDRLVELADAAGLDPLDDYVKAQVHGGLRFDQDVEAVVLDPCFIGTAVEKAAHRLGCTVVHHEGFSVSADALDPSYRGGRTSWSLAVDSETFSHRRCSVKRLGPVRTHRRISSICGTVWLDSDVPSRVTSSSDERHQQAQQHRSIAHPGHRSLWPLGCGCGILTDLHARQGQPGAGRRP